MYSYTHRTVVMMNLLIRQEKVLGHKCLSEVAVGYSAWLERMGGGGERGHKKQVSLQATWTNIEPCIGNTKEDVGLTFWPVLVFMVQVVVMSPIASSFVSVQINETQRLRRVDLLTPFSIRVSLHALSWIFCSSQQTFTFNNNCIWGLAPLISSGTLRVFFLSQALYFCSCLFLSYLTLFISAFLSHVSLSSLFHVKNSTARSVISVFMISEYLQQHTRLIPH